MKWMNKQKYADLRRKQVLDGYARDRAIRDWHSGLTKTQVWVSGELEMAPEPEAKLKSPRSMPTIVLPDEFYGI